MSYCAVGDGNWLRLEYTATPYGEEPFKVNDTFALERFPQPFGGYRWYIGAASASSRSHPVSLQAGFPREAAISISKI